MTRTAIAACLVAALFASACNGDDGNAAGPYTAEAVPSEAEVDVLAGMPAVIDPDNLYSETGPNHLSDAVADHLVRVYVPNRQDHTISVIDPEIYEVIDTYPVGVNPQHIVPSWDLEVLYSTDTAEGRADGSLTEIDPVTGKPGRRFMVDDPYNLYFTPDGTSGIVVAEARKRLDFYDPHTWELQASIDIPNCSGINHGDFTIDGKTAIFTCEFQGSLIKIDIENHTVLDHLDLSGGGMPQDIRVSPDGSVFYAADMTRGGVYTVDPATFTETGFIETGVGAHGLYPSRDATRLFVANRGHDHVGGNPPDGPGSISVLDFETGEVLENWPIPDGGSPDMGGVSIDGSELWLAGRYDNEIYVIDTDTGDVRKIPVGNGPHGLAIWPQPGRYSLGHTSNLR